MSWIKKICIYIFIFIYTHTRFTPNYFISNKVKVISSLLYWHRDDWFIHDGLREQIFVWGQLNMAWFQFGINGPVFQFKLVCIVRPGGCCQKTFDKQQLQKNFTLFSAIWQIYLCFNFLKCKFIILLSWYIKHSDLQEKFKSFWFSTPELLTQSRPCLHIQTSVNIYFPVEHFKGQFVTCPDKCNKAGWLFVTLLMVV